MIRKGNVSDAARLAELSEVLGYPVEPEVMRRRLETILLKPDHVVAVAEVSSNLIAGWIHAAEHDILEVGSFCEILGLVVAANHRGQGIGRRLLERVEHWALDRRLTQISVRSNAPSPPPPLFFLFFCFFWLDPHPPTPTNRPGCFWGVLGGGGAAPPFTPFG